MYHVGLQFYKSHINDDHRVDVTSFMARSNSVFKLLNGKCWERGFLLLLLLFFLVAFVFPHFSKHYSSEIRGLGQTSIKILVLIFHMFWQRGKERYLIQGTWPNRYMRIHGEGQKIWSFYVVHKPDFLDAVYVASATQVLQYLHICKWWSWDDLNMFYLVP